jgi:uncharacterized membrane protein
MNQVLLSILILAVLPLIVLLVVYLVAFRPRTKWRNAIVEERDEHRT